jgi:hypothetical protein
MVFLSNTLILNTQRKGFLINQEVWNFIMDIHTKTTHSIGNAILGVKLAIISGKDIHIGRYG